MMICLIFFSSRNLHIGLFISSVFDPGLRKDKEYFVKYRGLAHIHNQWIPESQLLLEAENLIEEFNRKNEVKHFSESL